MVLEHHKRLLVTGSLAEGLHRGGALCARCEDALGNGSVRYTERALATGAAEDGADRAGVEGLGALPGGGAGRPQSLEGSFVEVGLEIISR